MDVWLVKINAALGGTAIPAVLVFVAAAGWLVLRWDRNPSKSKRRAFALAGAAGAYVLLLSGTTATVNSLAFKRFLSLEHQPPSRAVVRVAGQPGERVTDAPAVRDLVSLVRRAPSARLHHAHPVPWVEVTIPEMGYVYRLGRDSERPDEFWLVWAAYPESGAPRELAYLRQFRSEELPDWLQQLAEAAGANQPLQRTATALPAR